MDLSNLSFGNLQLADILKVAEEVERDRKFDWERNAREKQLPPPGSWSMWVLMAGRGAGKTRTGAEYIRKLAKGGKHGRIAIIGPTAADVRDVMVEGESGILAISPANFSPIYEPSKRQLTWPNGVIGKLYSGEEPDRLRGPQHHAGWCLSGDAEITTDKGSIPIRDIVEGRLQVRVLDSSGKWRKIIDRSRTAGRQMLAVTIATGETLECTTDHPLFFEGKGFLPALRAISSVSGDIYLRCLRNRIQTQSCVSGAVEETALLGKVPKGNQPSGDERSVARRDDYQGLPLVQSGVQVPQKGIGASALLLETVLRGKRAPIVHGELPHVRGDVSQGHPEAEVLRDCVCGEAAQGIISGTRKRQIYSWRMVYGVLCRVSRIFQAGDKAKGRESLRGLLRRWSPASASYRRIKDESFSGKSSHTLPALPSHGAHKDRHKPEVDEPVRIIGVRSCETPDYVYNLTVEGSHEYFANGILTHNCDEIAAWDYPEAFTQFKLGFRLGTDLRCIVTTTPKPCAVIRDLIKQSKQSDRVVVVRGSTYENRANLAPEFFEDIIRQYEGTRLGRQELDGELLEDTPGALWNTLILDRTRCKEEPPEMVRIVVAVDPSVTSSGDSDECGISVCGKGIDGDAYVLADLSGIMSPHEWAKKAVWAYHEWNADAIIAETNNGGDLVGNTILAVDPSVPFRKVTASRGKVARAEPVSALFEQNRAHLVGA